MDSKTMSKLAFTDLLLAVNDGVFVEEASDALKTLVLSMEEQARVAGGKPKATMTLKVSFQIENGMWFVVPKLDVKQPERVRARTLLYATRDGYLVPNNPKQLDAFSGPVSEVAAEDTRARDIHDPPSRPAMMAVLP